MMRMVSEYVTREEPSVSLFTQSIIGNLLSMNSNPYMKVNQTVYYCVLELEHSFLDDDEEEEDEEDGEGVNSKVIDLERIDRADFGPRSSDIISVH